MKELIKKPLTWIPPAISFLNTLFLLFYVAFFGNSHHEDEGIPAHIFQLLVFAQIFLAIVFLIKWFSKKPKEAITIFILQIFAALIPFSVVYLLEL